MTGQLAGGAAGQGGRSREKERERGVGWVVHGSMAVLSDC